MGKQNWKPGNMLNPVPAVMVSVTDKAGNNNIITVAWAGTVCTNPPMLSISVRPERFSYNMIKETGEFVVNLTTEELLRACDYCGVKSGRDVEMTFTSSSRNSLSAICNNIQLIYNLDIPDGLSDRQKMAEMLAHIPY